MNHIYWSTLHKYLDQFRQLRIVLQQFYTSKSDPCSSYSTVKTGRFLHVEQEKTKLRDDISGWNKIANALNNTFECSSLSQGNQDVEEIMKIYPNPTSNSVSIDCPGLVISDVNILGIVGQHVGDSVIMYQNKPGQITVDLKGLATGTYVFKIKNTAKVIYKN